MPDFLGSGSITFWANAVFGIIRNTCADSFAEKCLTTYENIKNRVVGHKVGSKVYAMMDLSTGRLLESGAPPAKKDFDDGTAGTYHRADPNKLIKEEEEDEF